MASTTQPTAHQPVPREKQGSGYITDDGQEVAPHPLYCFDCICGYKASVWYASVDRAHGAYNRHLTAVGRVRPARPTTPKRKGSHDAA